MKRRELADRACPVAAPVRVQRCNGGELVLELGALAPPADWAACPDKPAPTEAMAVAPMTSPSTTLTLHR